MHLVNLVLFLHIAVVLVAFGISAVLHAAEWSARRATTVSELQVTFRVARRLEPLFPAMIAALFGLGATVSKPGAAGSVAVLVVGMGLGTVIGILGARPASVPATA